MTAQPLALVLDEPFGEGWDQVIELSVAFVLSAFIGLERELKHKSAGVRTYTVVGFASALWMMVSKFGFTDVLAAGTVVVDPSRVAAQIVAGVGFIGGGIIFVKRDAVRGLTTAAGIFLTAAVGAAAGAGLVLLATAATVAYFVAILALPPIAAFVKRVVSTETPPLRVHFADGKALLPQILSIVTGAGFHVTDIATAHHGALAAVADPTLPPTVEARIYIHGRGDLADVVADVADLDGVISVSTVDDDAETY